MRRETFDEWHERQFEMLLAEQRIQQFFNEKHISRRNQRAIDWTRTLAYQNWLREKEEEPAPQTSLIADADDGWEARQ
jgi:hypothetical protein